MQQASPYSQDPSPSSILVKKSNEGSGLDSVQHRAERTVKISVMQKKIKIVPESIVELKREGIDSDRSPEESEIVFSFKPHLGAYGRGDPIAIKTLGIETHREFKILTINKKFF